MKLSARRLINSFIAKRCVSTESGNSLSYPGKPDKSYQVIIIGAGHNGLVAAGDLQKAGYKVCVLERRHVIGGCAVTEEIVPGFKFSRASYLLSLLRPQIIEDLELKKYGLKLYMRNPSSYTPLATAHWKDGARSLTLSNDIEFNRREIAKFSVRDAEAYEGYERWLSRLVSAIDPLIEAKAIDLSFSGSLKETVGSVSNVLQSLLKMSGDVGSFYNLMTSPASKLLDQFFESEPLKATLATDALIGAMMGPADTVGSGYVLLHHVMGSIEGQQGAWAYPQGGMGSVSNAMARSAVARGASIFTDQDVEQMLMGDAGEVAGVRLRNGQEIRAPTVLSNATLKVTFNDLLPTGSLPQLYMDRVNAIDYTSPVVKINVALKELPNFLADPHDKSGPPAPHHQCTIHLNCEDSHMLEKAYQQGKAGLIPDRPMIEMTIPSSLDPTIAPESCHVALLFTQFVSYELQNGVPWDDHTKEVYARKVFRQIDEYAPGFEQSIVGYEVLAPPDLERIFGITGGNIFHGSMRLDQLYLARPFAAWKDVNGKDHFPVLPQTPVKGLYICGSSVHPGGGVMGIPGRLAAEQVIANRS